MTTRKNVALSLLAFALTFASTAPSAFSQERTIVTTALDAGSFNTLVAALQATGLDAALAGDGPFTVFAPTDEAFAKLPEGTVESLLEDIDALTAILTYHVVAGKMMAADVVGETQMETLNGKALQINVTSAGVEVGGARVIQTDTDAGNGIIHVIDSVMLPPAS